MHCEAEHPTPYSDHQCTHQDEVQTLKHEVERLNNSLELNMQALEALEARFERQETRFERIEQYYEARWQSYNDRNGQLHRRLNSVVNASTTNATAANRRVEQLEEDMRKMSLQLSSLKARKAPSNSPPPDTSMWLSPQNRMMEHKNHAVPGQRERDCRLCRNARLNKLTSY